MEGTPFGRYQLIELLGRGGMGEVWRAHDTSIDRIVALKMLLPHFAQDPEFERRFRREARAAARLDDPHIVPIYDVGEIDGRLYVTMRLIKGVDLQTLLDAGPLEPARAVHIIEQVASALHTAHRAGLVHRDVKPSNILLADNDFAYLIDFGIARSAGDTGLTSAKTTIGTWAYMAPERFGTGEIQASSDVYALACVLYQCLTGQPPYPGEALEQIAVGHMMTAPPRPSQDRDTIPTAMDQVIATGLAKQPAQRYPSTVEMAAAAREAITAPMERSDPAYAQPWESGSESPTTPARFMGSPSRKRRRGVLIGALAAVVLLIAGGVVAAASLTGDDDAGAAAPSTTAAAAPTSAAPPPNTGPFTGMYKAVFGGASLISGDGNGDGPRPPAGTYAVSSVCRPTGCVATAAKLGGDATFAPAVEFDDVGGSWVAVTLGTGECRGAPSEVWQVFRLQPQPDGTLTGEFTVTASNLCGSKHAVTFTRTGDVDLESLPDPANLPPRVISPAEALRGRYQVLRTFTNGAQQKSDLAVRTDCLRTGDRCMSHFHGVGGLAQPLVFGDGGWHMRTEEDSSGTCPGGTMHVTKTAQYPLPQPPANPIPLLSGHGNQQQSAPCAIHIEFDETFTRTGD